MRVKHALRMGFVGVGLLAAGCGDLPEPTEQARGIIGDVNAVLFLSLLFVVVAIGIIVGAVALERYLRTRGELAEASKEPEPVPDEEEESVVAGIGQATGRVPRWLYAAYVIIPVFAMLYVVNAVAIQAEFGVTPPEETPVPPPAGVSDTIHIVAEGIVFDLDHFVLPANTEVTIEFENRDSAPHDVAIFTDETETEEIFNPDTITGPATIDYEFTSPGPGEYYFLCTVHPSMNGVAEFVVPEEEPPPVDTEAVVEVTAERIQFDVDEFELPAETDVTIIFHNLDPRTPHDIAIFTDDSMTEGIFDGDLINGVATLSYEFTSPAPGEYFFVCTVHPSMNGTVRFT